MNTNSTLITGVKNDTRIPEREASPNAKKKEILQVDHVPINLLKMNIEGYVPMSEHFVVKFQRVKNNILNALKFLQNPVNNKKKHESKDSIKNRVDIWREKLSS